MLSTCSSQGCPLGRTFLGPFSIIGASLEILKSRLDIVGLLALLWHSVSRSEHNFARHAAEYRHVSSISGWSHSIFHFLRISLFQQYYNYFWNNCMEADCPKNLLLLFEEFYCRNVDAFGIVTLSTWCWNKLDVLYLTRIQLPDQGLVGWFGHQSSVRWKNRFWVFSGFLWFPSFWKLGNQKPGNLTSLKTI